MEKTIKKTDFTGWEVDLDEKLLIKKNTKFTLLIKQYPLIASNDNTSLTVMIRMSDSKEYKKPQNQKQIPLLSMYTSTTWRHLYLPNNYEYRSIEIIDDKIYIKTNKFTKIATFENLNNYPVFWDQTENNRRIFLERMPNDDILK